MPHDELFLRNHQCHMGDLVCSCWLLDLYSHLNPIQLFKDVGTFCSDFKKIMQHVAAKYWDWEPANINDPQELSDHVQNLYTELTEGIKYIHGECDAEVSDYFTRSKS